MARQATKRVRVASSDVATGTGVHAPSVVQTSDKAAQNWAALSNALRVGVQSGAQIKQVQNRQDLVAGAEAAALGDVTEDNIGEMTQSKAWLKGARSKLAERRAIADAAEAAEYYQQNLDKGLPVGDVDAAMTQWWSSKYEGMDPEMRKAVAPHMDAAHQRILAGHAALQNAETAAEIEEAVLVSTAQGLRDGAIASQEDWDMVRSEAVTLVGKDRANDLLVGSIETYVAESNDPEVWDKPWLEKLRTNPKYAQRIAKSQDDATREQTKAFQSKTVLERAAIEADLTERAKAGDPSILTDLPRLLEENLVDETITRSVVKQYASAVVAGTGQRINVEAFNNGVTSALDLNEDDYNDTTKAAFMEYQETNPEQAMALVLDGVAKNGRMPKWIKRIVENASPANPEGFDAAYEVYSTLRQADPVGYRRFMNEDTQTMFESYEVLVNDYGKPEVALQKLAETNPKLVADVPRSEWTEALNDAVAQVEDGPFFNNLDEADPYTRNVVKKRMNHMISMGYSLEKSAEFAVADIKERYLIAGGKLWPKTAGFQSDPTSVLEFGTAQYAAADPEGRDHEIVPVMGKPGYAWVRPVGSLPFAGEMVKVSDLDSRYRADQKRQRDEAIIAGQKAVKEEYLLKAKQRATGLYSLPHDKSVVGDRLREDQDEAWNKLSPAQQQEVIREIQAEAEAAEARRKARMDRINTSIGGA